MPQEPYYITTAIFYPNAKPHMGHAIELVQADFLARYHRLMGTAPVRFQTGLDEHGLKMQRTAEAAGMEPAEFVKAQSKTFEEFVKLLCATPDRFIRTTDADHEALAQAFWLRCQASGDIYKKTYRAWYDVKEEAFLGSADENPDPSVFGIDSKFIELIEEENYFFACSKYSNKVLEILESGEYEVVPANRCLEMVNFVKEKGLADVSISRERSKLQWGIPVPGDPDQVMYVWFDALTNYLTGASTLVEGEIKPDQYWPTSLHCVGKDIARFHALLWPAMLLSAGIALPKQLLVHGFVLSGGRKMSKSLGNGVDPVEIVDTYGIDALRWFLLSAMPTQDDGDFTEERLRQVYSSDLANDYGNLVSRVLTMCHKYCNGFVPDRSAAVPGGAEQVKTAWEKYQSGVQSFRFEVSCDAVRGLVLYCNRRIDECKPWVMAKDPAQRKNLDDLLFELLEILAHVTLMLRPVIPNTAERVQKDVFMTKDDAYSSTQKEVPQWGVLSSGSQLGETGIQLFPRLP